MTKPLSKLLIITSVLIAFIGQALAYAPVFTVERQDSQPVSLPDSLQYATKAISIVDTQNSLDSHNSPDSQSSQDSLAEEDDCCTPDCCDDDCFCSSGTCNSLVYAQVETKLTLHNLNKEGMGFLLNQSPIEITTFLYRPPIFTS